MYAWPASYLAENFRALGDENRLTILRLLHEHERNVGELASLLNISEPTASHHLAKLRELQLVTLRMAGNQHFYGLNNQRLSQLKAQVGRLEQAPPAEEAAPDNAWIDTLGWPKADCDVLRKHVRGQRLVRIPMKHKEQVVLARWLATQFEPGERYTEKQVNAILLRHHEDYAFFRRTLVDLGYMRREIGGGKYWLAEEA